MTPAQGAEAARRPARTIAIAAANVLLAIGIAGAGYGIWYLFLQPAGPAAVADATLAPVPSAAAAQALSGGIDGAWQVDTSIGSFADSTGSFVGYRVQEQLASIGANIAVGRTPNVTGTLTISRTQVTDVQITADLTALQSNDQRRDGQLQRQGIQTGTYPTATFKLTSPIDLGSIPADGQEISATASGQLTLHGVTRDVQIPLKARLSGSVIEVTGSLPIAFSDYGIQKPNSFAVLSVADQGTMELQLFFTKA